MEADVTTNSQDRVRVLIATTQGPVEIEAILDLEPGEFSIVALGSSADLVTGLMVTYRNFIARGSGVIARQFGHDAFRLELSAEIHAGESWQLAVFIAHALHKEGRLAEVGEPAGTLVWATGLVDYQLRVSEIGHIPDKFIASLPRFTAERLDGTEVHVVWPKANGTDADLVMRERLAGLGVSVHEVDQVGPVLAALGIPLAAAAPKEGAAWKGAPYCGLAAFGEAERAIFFGRGRAREEALARLRTAAARDTAFLLIHGGSGAGKSSLARAGLLGDIVLGADGADAWRSIVLPPVQIDRSPLQALAQALAAALPELEADPQLRDDALLDRMLNAPVALVDRIDTILNRAGGGQRSKLVLLIDQFEDVLLWPGEAGSEHHRARSNDREGFALLIERLAKNGSVWIIATLRSDLLALLENCQPLSRLAADVRLYRLERPNPTALREMILGPARLVGLSFEGAVASGTPVAERIVEAAARSPDSLPLLQFALARLYDLRDRKNNAITSAAYDRIGGLEGAIGQYAEETILPALGGDSALAGALDDIILAMARWDQGTGTMVARSVALNENFVTPSRARVIQALAAARLVGIDDAIEGSTLRVAHQALLSHWPRAEQLLETQRAALSLREKLEAEAHEWDAQGRDPSYHLQAGHALVVAETLVTDNRIDLSRQARAFIRASAQAAKSAGNKEFRRLRRNMAIAIATSILMTGLVAVSAWSWLHLGRIELQNRVFQAVDNCFTINGYIDLRQNKIALAGEMTGRAEAGAKIFDEWPGAPRCSGMFASPYTIKGTLDDPVFTVDTSAMDGFVKSLNKK